MWCLDGLTANFLGSLAQPVRTWFFSSLLCLGPALARKSVLLVLYIKGCIIRFLFQDSVFCLIQVHRLAAQVLQESLSHPQ